MLGILGFLWVTPILAIIFGCIALSRINRSGQGGRGLAIAGVVLGTLWIALFVVLVAVGVIAGVAGSAERAPRGDLLTGGTVSVTDLHVGDCVDTVPTDTTDTLTVTAVPCSEPHRGEIFALLDLPSGPYPGTAEVTRLGEEGCAARLPGYSQSAAADPNVGITFLYPTEGGWRSGDRGIACSTRTSLPTTGSIRVR